ncbi:MAG: T9SS type A sorting domain-containing protein [Cyclobacteriaceae bacterium]
MKTGNIFYFLIALLTVSLGAAAQPAFFGTVTTGGENFVGTVYSTDGNGENYQVVFEGQAGATEPLGKLVEVASGVFYGMAPFSFAYGGDGVIFEFNANTGAYTVKHTFSYTDGSYPEGSLTKAANGKLYGLTKDGGVNEEGVIFEYDYITSTYTKLHDLDQVITGAYPTSTFFEASNGKLYAPMTSGGATNYGTIVEFDPATNILLKRADFNGTGNGGNPEYTLVERSGKLYGITSYGGSNDSGALFVFDLNTFSLNNLHNFPIGARVRCTPVIASNDKLYGITSGSGIDAAGELFEYDFNTLSFINKVQMDDFGLAGCVGTLLEYNNGKLLGLCQSGGANDEGAIFEYDVASSAFSIKIDFDIKVKSSKESFIMGSDGQVYGFAAGGGTSKSGSIYRYDPTAISVTELYSFNALDIGYYPEDLIQSVTGKLYGVNKGGGVYGAGTLFEMDPNTYLVTPLVQFKPKPGGGSGRVATSINANDISSPHALIQASNGKLYGRTNNGGDDGRGVIFEYDPIELTFEVKAHFTEMTGNNGSGTRGGLLEVNGKLYGACRRAGPSGGGTIFEFDISTSSFSAIADLGAIGISEPNSNLVLSSNGKLYGVSNAGGTNGKGTIYEYDIINEIATVKVNFNDVSGVAAFGGLAVAADDKLLGMTYAGGASGKGEIYEYVPSSNTYTTLASFDGIAAGNPTNDLLLASNDNFYGLGSSSIFEFDAMANLITKKNDLPFGGASRFEPAALLETCKKPAFDQPADVRQCAGTSLSLEVNSANADSYIWKKDGQVIGGQTSAQLSISNTVGADSGTYTCELTNVCGTTIVSAVVIIDELSIATTFDGTEVSVAATGGTSPYTYSSNGTDFQPSSTLLLANGQYTITVRDANSCEASSTENLAITGVNGAVEKKAITPYPNPVKSTLSLEGLAQGARVRMLDVAGRVVYDQILREANASISTEALKSGLYILETTDSKGNIERVRVLKE